MKNFDTATPHQKTTLNSKINRFQLSLENYNKTRNIQTLFGISPADRISGFIRSIAMNISSFDPSLQQTIIKKLDNLRILKKRARGFSENYLIADSPAGEK